MNRREILKLGATIAGAPAAALAQQIHPPVPDLSKAKPAVADPSWAPVFFTDRQNEMIIALSEAIIPATDTPGAKAALVNRHMDKILADSTSAQRTPVVKAVDWIDGYATKTLGQPFARSSQADQNSLLEKLASADPQSEERLRFEVMKSFVSRIYYATEIGFKELNKGGRVPTTFACSHR